MDESITRSAGAVHGQELSPARMEAIIGQAGRTPRQRTTLYGRPDEERVAKSFAAGALTAKVNTPLRRKGEAGRLDWAV